MDKLRLEIFYIYFSPYTAHAVGLDGVAYPTVEHAYQCQRYVDEDIKNEILNARSPMLAWQVSRKYRHLQIPEFKNDDYQREVMKRIMRLKAEQHDEVRQALLDSGDQQIIKHILTYPPGNGYWDDGENGEGRNEMGRIWMELREEFRDKK